MNDKYIVTLTEEEVATLKKAGSKGFRNAKTVKKAQALLLVDKGEFTNDHWSTTQTAEAVGLTKRTLINMKKTFVEEGLDQILHPKPDGRSTRPVKFDGEFDTRITMLACGKPPDGRNRWTLKLLADKAVELKFTDTVSVMTVQRALKKTNCDPT